jgi:hypothetical protein
VHVSLPNSPKATFLCGAVDPSAFLGAIPEIAASSMGLLAGCGLAAVISGFVWIQTLLQSRFLLQS